MLRRNLCFAASAALHLACFLLLPSFSQRPRAMQQNNAVEVSLIDDPPVVEEAVEVVQEEEEPTPPPATPTPRNRPNVPATTASRAPEASEEPPAAAEETPVAFDDVTLTNDNGESWESETGSGEDSGGIIGRPGLATGRDVRGSRDGVVGGTGTGSATKQAEPFVAFGSLASPPNPPDLSATLERNFPKEARQQGVEGNTRVRLRISAEGKVSDLRVLSESVRGYGFGQACMKTLRGSRWTPGRDAKGQAVATIIPGYTCEFTVRY